MVDPSQQSYEDVHEDVARNKSIITLSNLGTSIVNLDEDDEQLHSLPAGPLNPLGATPKLGTSPLMAYVENDVKREK